MFIPVVVQNWGSVLSCSNYSVCAAALVQNTSLNAGPFPGAGIGQTVRATKALLQIPSKASSIKRLLCETVYMDTILHYN